MTERLGRRNTLLLLIALICLEGIVAAKRWTASAPRPLFGYLIKQGKTYLLTWKLEEHQFGSKAYRSLPDALAFAREELRLQTGHNPFSGDDLERAWMQDRRGATILFWKTMSFQYLNQLTFDRQADARFFVDAFRRGAYSRSPFGHSIFLSPSVD